MRNPFRLYRVISITDDGYPNPRLREYTVTVERNGIQSKGTAFSPAYALTRAKTFWNGNLSSYDKEMQLAAIHKLIEKDAR